MANNNNDILGDIGGFFGALFGACIAEDRKAKKENTDVKPRDKKGGNNVWQNLTKAMIPDKNEVKHLARDFGQLDEAGRFRKDGWGSQISDATEYATGQKPPGLVTGVVDMITGETPKYALPLDENKRAKTISDLKKYGKKKEGELDDTANIIAGNLEQKNSWGNYEHQSLASAANKAGMSKEKIEGLARILERQTQAREQAQKEVDSLRKSLGGSRNPHGIPVGGGASRSPSSSGGAPRGGGGRG
ncbi:MAG: hypothetical protein ACKO47_01925 [Alphaproteobacteria bacterium]